MKNQKNSSNNAKPKMGNKEYLKELRKLQVELCRLQDWVKHKGLRIVLLFEGRDGAGKGGTIKAIAERASPRIFRIVFWLEVNNEEQERRFQARIDDPLRQWKLSPMDLPSRSRWYEYSRARDMMLQATDTETVPWYIVRSDDKKRARLNCISHLLSLIHYEKAPKEKIKMPKRSAKGAYDDATLKGKGFVPEKY